MAIDAAAPSYRDRLLGGMAASLAERTYRDTTIRDVVAHAHTSRRTFYQEFEGLDDCYFALLRSVHGQMLGAVTSAIDITADWRIQVRQAVTAYFSGVQAHPAVIRSYVREMASLGDPSVTKQYRPRDQFVELLVGLSTTEAIRKAGITPLSTEMARFLVGGIEELTAMVVEDDRSVDDIIEVAIEGTTALLDARVDPSHS